MFEYGMQKAMPGPSQVDLADIEAADDFLSMWVEDVDVLDHPGTVSLDQLRDAEYATDYSEWEADLMAWANCWPESFERE